MRIFVAVVVSMKNNIPHKSILLQVSCAILVLSYFYISPRF